MKQYNVTKKHIDYKTGDVVTKQVTKQTGISRNKITVELFDGEDKVQESHSENLVIPFNLTNMYSALNSILCPGSNIANAITPRVAGFNRLILSDDYSPEDANCYFMKGNRIHERGHSTYNVAESWVSQDKNKIRVHLVYDYRTDEANGTFQSLWWRPTSSGDNDTPLWGATQFDLPLITTRDTQPSPVWHYTCLEDGTYLKIKYNHDKCTFECYEVDLGCVFWTAVSSYSKLKVEDTPSYKTIYHDKDLNYYHITCDRPFFGEASNEGYWCNVNITKYSKTGDILDDYSFNMLDYLDSSMITDKRLYYIDFCPLMVTPEGMLLMHGVHYSWSAGGTSSSSFNHYTYAVINLNTKTVIDACTTYTKKSGIAYDTVMKYTITSAWSSDYPYEVMKKSSKNSRGGYIYYGGYVKFPEHYKLSPNENPNRYKYIVQNARGYENAGFVFGDNLIQQDGTFNNESAMMKSPYGGYLPKVLYGYGGTTNYYPRFYDTNIGSMLFTYFVSNDNVTPILVQLPNYTAHTVLAAPITKTSQYTMKIQYDITFELPNLHKWAEYSGL